ncbi:MAG TPA: permease prefix domain 1-containing protein [Solirubrobacteraceae bacterium]|jgi:hypothetical protein|nr:permease prefix domain 1-containing protein [Solirubrobacteraceae bacterium]
MSTPDPIALYIKELKAHLRARGLRRRRIICEVQAHLRQRRSDLQRTGMSEPHAAEREAIARFGDAQEMAAQFNRLDRGFRPFERRLVALWLAWIAAMGMGSATVWAAVDSSGPPAHAVQHHATHVGDAGPFCALAGSRPADLLKVSALPPIVQPQLRRQSRGDDHGCQ